MLPIWQEFGHRIYEFDDDTFKLRVLPKLLQSILLKGHKWLNKIPRQSIYRLLSCRSGPTERLNRRVTRKYQHTKVVQFAVIRGIQTSQNSSTVICCATWAENITQTLSGWFVSLSGGLILKRGLLDTVICMGKKCIWHPIRALASPVTTSPLIKSASLLTWRQSTHQTSIYFPTQRPRLVLCFFSLCETATLAITSSGLLDVSLCAVKPGRAPGSCLCPSFFSPTVVSEQL